jgi:hypothetical protein
MERMEHTTSTQSGDSRRKEGLMASIISIASRHAAANSSAAFCLTEARERIAEGREDLAREWALRSLAHSVGIFAAEYKEAQAA